MTKAATTSLAAPWSRRRWLKFALQTSACLAAVPGCGGSSKKTLRVANWADLIGDRTIADFERETGVSVIYETYSKNEDLAAKLRIKNDVYDVVFPSDYMVEELAGEGLLAKLDHAKLPNIANLNPSFLRLPYDPSNTFSIPYVYWGTGIAVNRKRFLNPKPEWSDLFSDEAAGRVTVLDEMRYTIAMALLMDGRSINTESDSDLETAGNQLIKLKPRLSAFITDVKELLIAGDTSLSYAYSGDVFQASRQNPDISFHMPKGDGVFGIDNACITSGVQNSEYAHAFLNFLMRPEVAANTTNTTRYATPNAKAPFSAEDLQNPAIFIPISAFDAKKNVLRHLEKETTRKYIDCWRRVKSA